MKFSFIIPCHNSEKYLKECIESILQQTFENWEMILVDDGSVDSTGEIIQSYASRDNRIRGFQQENQGVSETRNRGIEKAIGDYLIFIDSDDWYKDENCLKQIADILDNEKTDIVVFRYQTGLDNNNMHDIEYFHYFARMKDHPYTGEEYLQNVLSESEVYPWFPWIYAFKREFWIKNQIKFSNKLWILEDMDVIYQVILKAKKIIILDSIIYQYRQREGSVVHIVSKQSIHAKLDVCKKNIKAVSCMDINEELRELLYSNFSYAFFQILIEVYFLHKHDRKEVFKLLEKNRYLMNYTIRDRNVFIRKLTYILGLRITSKLLYIRYKWRQRNLGVI